MESKIIVSWECPTDGFHYELGTALEQVSEESAAVEEYKTSCNYILTRPGHKKPLTGCKLTARRTSDLVNLSIVQGPQKAAF
jgi:hypothetical protein